MDWYAEAELTGHLEREQLEQAAEGAFLAHYNEKSEVLRLRTRLDAQDYPAAVEEALRWVAGLNVIRAGMLTGPDRILVESAAARAREWPLLGTAEIAARFGVSTTRVRQLEQRPDFPAPLQVLVGGRVYRAEDIAAFERTWKREPGRPSNAAPSA
ncbi:helix-turn-helix transcriptional regulator [Micromonospora haikouensis]|uniref:helix-turn-helix transcriptional regulator n=1 Tax=Micromonospora haikouensis TaxID=686309 RepID=UPI003D7535B0